jgi:hypothetical protein
MCNEVLPCEMTLTRDCIIFSPTDDQVKLKTWLLNNAA